MEKLKNLLRTERTHSIGQSRLLTNQTSNLNEWIKPYRAPRFGAAASTLAKPVNSLESASQAVSQASPQAEPQLAIDPGDTFTDALDLGIFDNTNQVLADAVSDADPEDFFKLELSRSRTLNLFLSGLSLDVDLALYNRLGGLIARSAATGSTPESINRSLAAGIYYVRVYAFDVGTTVYNLSLVDSLPIDDAGNTLATARALPLSTTPTTVTDLIDSNDPLDFYRVDVSNGRLNLAVTGLNADLDVSLVRDLNNNGSIDSSEELARSERGGFNDEALNLAALANGTYFIRVYQYNGDSNYTLKVSNSAPSNLLLSELDESTPDLLLTNAVGNGNTSDVYRFTLNRSETFNAAIGNLSADADMRLIQDLNSNGVVDSGEEIVRSELASTQRDFLAQTLDAGTYFLQVYQYQGETSYELSVFTSPIDGAGNTFETARSVSVGQTPTQIEDFVGNPDPNDYYRLTLNSQGHLNVAITNLVADADVELYSSTGVLLNRSQAANAGDEAINQLLSAGTYYLRIYQFSNDTNYRLQLSATPALSETPSNLLPTEADAGILTNSSIAFTGSISSTNTADVIRFDLLSNNNVSLALTDLSATLPNDADLFLVQDINGNGIVEQSEILARSVNAVGQNEAIQANNLTAGTYYVLVNRFNGSTDYRLTLSAVTAGSTRLLSGSLNADTFTYTGGFSRTVISGGGNVNFGSGFRDVLNLSNLVSTSVFFNDADITTGGTLFNPGNGSRLFDAITLPNGNEILFEGIDRLVFADRTIDLSITPNDPLFNQQWNLHMMGVQNAWRFTTGSDQVALGIEDTGLGLNGLGQIHPDLGSTIIYPNNYADDFSGSDTSHGTGVQGIMAATANNGIGLSGINWNSTVFSIDVLGGDLNDQSIAQAAQNLLDNVGDRRLVINMSLGVPTSFGINYDTDLEQFVANHPNVLFVIAAGNNGNLGRRGISSPAYLAAQYANVMAIGASWGTTDRDGLVRSPGERIEYSWWGSQYGEGLTLMGPSEVVSTRAANSLFGVGFDYYQGAGDRFNGTSAAAPNVAGVASLVWSANPNLTAIQVQQILSQTATDLGDPGYDELYGYGFVNADAAVRRAIALSRPGTASELA